MFKVFSKIEFNHYKNALVSNKNGRVKNLIK